MADMSTMGIRDVDRLLPSTPCTSTGLKRHWTATEAYSRCFSGAGDTLLEPGGIIGRVLHHCQRLEVLSLQHTGEQTLHWSSSRGSWVSDCHTENIGPHLAQTDQALRLSTVQLVLRLIILAMNACVRSLPIISNHADPTGMTAADMAELCARISEPCVAKTLRCVRMGPPVDNGRALSDDLVLNGLVPLLSGPRRLEVRYVSAAYCWHHVLDDGLHWKCHCSQL